MAVLITGLGYIGSALALRVLQRGERVVAIESFFSTPRASLAPLLANNGLTLVEGSITDSSVLAEAFSRDRVEAVFHLAAQSSAAATAASIAYTQETNFTGPRLLLDAHRASGVGNVVIASSMRLYRTPLPAVVDEDAPMRPTDLVHLSQLYGEVLLEEHRRRGVGESSVDGFHAGPFQAAAARIGIVHGVSPVMKTDPRFLAAPQLFCLRAALGQPLEVATGPTTELAFVHIDDVVTALLQCRDHAGEITVANVGAEVRSVLSVAEAVRRAAADRGFAVEIRARDGDSLSPDEPSSQAPARTIVSTLDAYGFCPTRSVEDSIGQVLDHYLAAVARLCASS